MPNRVTNINDYTFYSCSRLTSVTLHGNIIRIGIAAFDYCTGLEKVNYTGTPTQWSKITIRLDNEYLLNAERNFI
ncbi:MAG: leucine-rich repeat protein [Candidatus Neoclostridium sp.]